MGTPHAPAAGEASARRRVIAVFGGAFDPPHVGHVLVPPYVLARGWADEVWVVPAADHPFGKAMAPLAERLRLLQLAFAGAGAAVRVSGIEGELLAAKRTGGATEPLYTVEVLEAIAALRPSAQVRLVLGSDAWAQRERWRAWATIEARFDPIVIARAGYADPDACALPEVSSQAVRDALARARAGDGDARQWVSARVPAAVATALLDADAGEPAATARGTAPIWVVGQGHVGTRAVAWLRARGFTAQPVSARAWGGARADGDAPTGVPAGTPAAIWLTVADPALATMDAAVAAAALDRSVPVLHAAGSRPASEALARTRAAGHPVGSAHPIASLRRGAGAASGAGGVDDPEAIGGHPGVAFGIEGDEAARAAALAWVGSGPWVDLQALDRDGRAAYHAACALAANHVAVLVGAASEVWRQLGIPPAHGEPALAALARSAATNLAAHGLAEGVSGPVARGDTDAVLAHLRALAAIGADEPRARYVQLAEALARQLGRDELAAAIVRAAPLT